MKLLYRILLILLWIHMMFLFFFGLPICLIISPFIYLFTGRTKGLFFDLYSNLFDELVDTAERLAKKGE